ncbi:MAG TPA: rhodanese-like domain-containing protein [Aggregatilineales bacterium]|nr:rhodanese-like domain-containing protein [Chloroflexota bacterium]HOA24945.1 rhodanese-like domain-containing protein [Aggregatilineales bacterium]HPV05688.1 rhodanese-like domain-containing protein [Aggregatilineales bacterium]HQA67972.1 rhodanese-like domain-containing protein [Aggregatilineales bacterium]
MSHMTSHQESGRDHDWGTSADGVQDSRVQPVMLTPTQVYDRFVRANEHAILLDIRNPNEWAEDGRIEGAKWIPMYELPRRAQKELPRDVPVVVYCAHGVRSAVMARYLRGLGFSNVIDMAGGLLAWQRAGLPVQVR